MVCKFSDKRFKHLPVAFANQPRQEQPYKGFTCVVSSVYPVGCKLMAWAAMSLIPSGPSAG